MARTNKESGTIAETAAATALLKEGFAVSFAHGDSAAWDLACDWQGKVNRLQVKTASQTRRSYQVGFCHLGGNSVRYNKKDCDIICVWLPYRDDYMALNDNGIYLIPIKAINVSCGRFWPPGYSSKGPDKVCRWEKYRDKFTSLK